MFNAGNGEAPHAVGLPHSSYEMRNAITRSHACALDHQLLDCLCTPGDHSQGKWGAEKIVYVVDPSTVFDQGADDVAVRFLGHSGQMECSALVAALGSLVYLSAIRYRQYDERFMTAFGSPLECSEFASISQTKLDKAWGEEVRQSAACAKKAKEVWS